MQQPQQMDLQSPQCSVPVDIENTKTSGDTFQKNDIEEVVDPTTKSSKDDSQSDNISIQSNDNLTIEKQTTTEEYKGTPEEQKGNDISHIDISEKKSDNESKQKKKIKKERKSEKEPKKVKKEKSTKKSRKTDGSTSIQSNSHLQNESVNENAIDLEKIILSNADKSSDSKTSDIISSKDNAKIQQDKDQKDDELNIETVSVLSESDVHETKKEHVKKKDKNKKDQDETMSTDKKNVHKEKSTKPKKEKESPSKGSDGKGLIKVHKHRPTPVSTTPTTKIKQNTTDDIIEENVEKLNEKSSESSDGKIKIPVVGTRARTSSSTSWSNTNRNQFRKSVSLSTVQLDLKPKELKSNVEMFEEMVIEISNTYDKVDAAREHLTEITKNHSNSKVKEFLSMYEEIIQCMQKSSNNVLLDDTDKFNELKDLNVFMADMYHLGFNQFKVQTSQLTRLMIEAKKFLEESKDCVKCKSDFEKLQKDYNKICLKMMEEKDEKKSKLALQSRDDMISKGIGDGRKALEIFDKYLKKYYEILQSSGKHVIDVSKKNNEKMHQTLYNVEDKIQIWGELDFDDEGIEEGELQDWMKQSNIKKIVTNEFMYVNTLTILLERYFNDLANSSLLVQTGICLEDINIIFRGIIPFSDCHKTILKLLKTSNAKNFLDCYLAYYGKLYQQYHHYLLNYRESYTLFLKCMEHKIFREIVENIDTMEGLEMKELLQSPLRYITEFSENLEKVTTVEPNTLSNLQYIFNKLLNELQQTNQQIEAANQISKVYGFEDPNPQTRIFIGKVIATHNKIVGNLLVFSDVLLFTRSERGKTHLVSQILVEQLESPIAKDKKVEIRFLEKKKGAETKSLEFIVKDNNSVTVIMEWVNKVIHQYKKYYLFGQNISVAAISRDETKYFFPHVLHKFFDKCEKEAPSQEGVLRLSVNVVQLDCLIKRINLKEEIDLDKLDVHVVINVLKKYCNSIPNKLPPELQVVDLNDNAVENIQKIIKSMDCDAFIAFIERLFRLLHIISLKEDINLMGSSNLSKVISPNIYEDDGSVYDFEKLTATVTYMIDNYEVIFEPIRSHYQEIFKENDSQNEEIQSMEKEMELTKYNDIKASSVIRNDENFNPKNLLLKDVIHQCEIECVESKKTTKRWLIVTKTMLVEKKSVDEFGVLMELPLKGLKIQRDDKITLVNGTKSIILTSALPVVNIIDKLKN
ncbi:Rho-GAP domain-containing protein [Entamoeba marina]